MKATFSNPSQQDYIMCSSDAYHRITQPTFQPMLKTERLQRRESGELKLHNKLSLEDQDDNLGYDAYQMVQPTCDVGRPDQILDDAYKVVLQEFIVNDLRSRAFQQPVQGQRGPFAGVNQVHPQTTQLSNQILSHENRMGAMESKQFAFWNLS
jgi:hypothetical protein